jgi:hypothetical protein
MIPPLSLRNFRIGCFEEKLTTLPDGRLRCQRIGVRLGKPDEDLSSGYALKSTLGTL